MDGATTTTDWLNSVILAPTFNLLSLEAAKNLVQINWFLFDKQKHPLTHKSWRLYFAFILCTICALLLIKCTKSFKFTADTVLSLSLSLSLFLSLYQAWLIKVCLLFALLKLKKETLSLLWVVRLYHPELNAWSVKEGGRGSAWLI